MKFVVDVKFIQYVQFCVQHQLVILHKCPVFLMERMYVNTATMLICEIVRKYFVLNSEKNVCNFQIGNTASLPSVHRITLQCK